MARYELKDMIKTKYKGVEIYICPECKRHIRGDSNEFHDCKNLYTIEKDKDGKILRQGQCQCYSVEHGRRDR